MSGSISSSVKFPKYKSGETIATRKVWGAVIESMALSMPTLVGGSADLEPSNVTSGFAEMVKDFGPNTRDGRNFAYGVREFPMGAINNGIAQHGGMKVFGATFFVFSDYERPALRLRALQNLDAVSEYTHDSIYVGEDGPTHQPVEHLMACRSIPNLLVLRPADANEAVEAIKLSFSLKRPSLVLLSRQGLPVIDREEYAPSDLVEKGGYILSDVASPDLIIYCSGSEVHLALDAKKSLSNYRVRVVNMFSWELFDEQNKDYKNTILSKEFEGLRVSIEAGITMGWERFTGLKGLNIGINSFGESAPGKDVANHFGLNSEEVVKKILEKLS